MNSLKPKTNGTDAIKIHSFIELSLRNFTTKKKTDTIRIKKSGSPILKGIVNANK